MTTSEGKVIVFPGQGAQRNGMGADFSAEFPEARVVFERASGALGIDVAALCHGDDERLNLTEFTQPCILTCEIAMLEALRAHFGLAPEWFGGHSLGEYTALVAAGAMPFEAAVQLVRLRGQLMQQAVAPGLGAMVALILADGLPLERIREVAARHGVDVANENSPAQVVLSGHRTPLEPAVAELSAEVPGLRATWLNVSAPFHCRHMAVIEPRFREALDAIRGELCAERARSVVSNTTGGFHTGDADALVDALVRQISGAVRWTENMRALGACSPAILELGPNRPLRGFFQTLGLTAQSVMDLRSARRLFAPSAG